MNAFGFSPSNDDNGNAPAPIIQRSPAPSRLLNTKEMDGDEISVCSLEDEDEVEEEDVDAVNESHA